MRCLNMPFSAGFGLRLRRALDRRVDGFEAPDLLGCAGEADAGRKHALPDQASDRIYKT
jgi:hypothetical protein